MVSGFHSASGVDGLDSIGGQSVRPCPRPPVETSVTTVAGFSPGIDHGVIEGHGFINTPKGFSAPVYTLKKAAVDLVGKFPCL